MSRQTRRTKRCGNDAKPVTALVDKHGNVVRVGRKRYEPPRVYWSLHVALERAAISTRGLSMTLAELIPCPDCAKED